MVTAFMRSLSEYLLCSMSSFDNSTFLGQVHAVRIHR